MRSSRLSIDGHSCFESIPSSCPKRNDRETDRASQADVNPSFRPLSHTGTSQPERTKTFTKKPNARILFLVSWLLEKPPGERLFTQSQGGDVWLYDTVDAKDGKPVLDRIFPKDRDSDIVIRQSFGSGSMAFDVTDFWRAGFFDHRGASWSFGDRKAAIAHKAFLSGYSGHPLPDRHSIYVANDKLAAWWNETGKALHDANLAVSASKSAAVKRTILLGITVSVRFEPPEDLRDLILGRMSIPKISVRRRIPFATATVTKETGQRLYVEDVTYLPVDWKTFERTGGQILVHGSRPNEYVERESVMMDRVTRRKVDRILAVEEEYAASLRTIHEDALREMLPLMSAFGSRMLQKIAEADDMVREARSDMDDTD